MVGDNRHSHHGVEQGREPRLHLPHAGEGRRHVAGRRPSRASRQATPAAYRSGSGWRPFRRPSTSTIRSRALSPMAGIEAWPARPSVREPEAKHPLLPHAQRVEAAALVLDDLPGALVHDHVAAHLVGHVLAQPLGADRRARLLVARRDHQQLARGRPPPGAAERARGCDLARDLSLHVQRASPPYVAIAQLARPRVDAPLRGIREHRVDVAQITEPRPVRRAAQPGNEVRPLVAHSQQLALEPGRLELATQELLGRSLVAGRVDSVEPDQPLEQCGRVVSKGHRLIMNDPHVDRRVARQVDRRVARLVYIASMAVDVTSARRPSAACCA